MDERQSGGLAWKPMKHHGLGHRWEGGYREDMLITVRCANCGLTPIDTLLKNLKFQPCMTAKGPER